MNKQCLASIFLLVPLLAVASTAAKAGTVSFYTDRALWLADATAAGLTVTTDDFSEAPPNYPQISVGGSEWTLDIRTGIPWDGGHERLGYTSGGGRILRLDYTGGAAQVFGFGIDMGPTVGLLSATDVEGGTNADSAGLGADSFLGLLGTAVFNPANGMNNGNDEIGTSGLAMTVYFDNLSVATAPVSPVPVPAAAWLFGSALLGLFGAGQRRKT